jgi:hypothetical protein
VQVMKQNNDLPGYGEGLQVRLLDLLAAFPTQSEF